MTDVSAEVMAAVRRKLNVTWESAETDGRIKDAIQSASATLAARLGYEQGRAFTPNDGPAWGLFLNAVLYEFSDALDDFWANYAEELRACRALVTTPKAGDESEP